MSENDEDWENPYSALTTAGSSYKAMRLEMNKKKVTLELPNEELILIEDSISASDKKSKVNPLKLQVTVTSQNSTATTLNSSVADNLWKENCDIPGGRMTRSRAKLSKESTTSYCESTNQTNKSVKQGRKGRKPTKNNRNTNVEVLNAEPIEIPDSPSPVVGITPSIQDELIMVSDESDPEVGIPVSKEWETSFTEDDNDEISVRVWWKFGSIDKFCIRKYQKFTTIFQHYAQLENVPKENILLMLKNVKIKESDTPDSTGVVSGMIIEGGVCGSSSSATTSIKEPEAVPNKESIELRIQQKGKKMPLLLTINKTQKMRVLMLKCAEQLDLPLNKLRFYFDGEAVSPEDTPEDLDLEGDECMDLHILE